MAAFIKFDGVDGESVDKDHKKWSDLVAFSQNVSQPGGGKTGSSRRRGDVTLDDIAVTKELDMSSNKIAESVCKGHVFPKVEIALTASTTAEAKVTYFMYELKNVLVTSYSISGTGAQDENPVEDIALNFEEIKVTYTETTEAGAKGANVEYQWKVGPGTS